MGRGALRAAAAERRSTLPVRGARDGQAGGPRAQRRERRRSPALLRDRRRRGAQGRRRHRPVLARALHARLPAPHLHDGRGDRGRDGVARRPAPPPGGIAGPAGQLARRGGAVLRDVGTHLGARRARPGAGRGGRRRVRRGGARRAGALRVAARGEPQPGRRDDRARGSRAERARQRAGARPEARVGRHPRGGVLRPVAPADLGRARADGAQHQHARRAPAPPCARAGDRSRGARARRRLPCPPEAGASRAVRNRAPDPHAPCARRGGGAPRADRAVARLQRRRGAGEGSRQDAAPRGRAPRVAVAPEPRRRRGGRGRRAGIARAPVPRARGRGRGAGADLAPDGLRGERVTRPGAAPPRPGEAPRPPAGRQLA